MKTFTQLLEDTYTSEYKVKKVLGPDGKWHDHKLRPHRIDFKNSKMHGEPAQKDSGDDVGMKEESTPYWKKPSFNKRMSQMAKRERLEREKKEAEKKTVKEENMTIDEQINEVLSKDATAGDWIHDFVHSDNPKFEGKSKEKRKQMALAAYYAKQQNEEFVVEERGAYEKSEENKRSADAAKKQGNMFDHHLHMADYHDNLAQWHSEKGRHGVSDSHAEKSEQHHEKAMALKENAPVAPVPDRKYIKGTPEWKAHKEKSKPINGHPTNVKEGTMKSFKEMLQSLDESNYDSSEEANSVASKLKAKYNDGNYHVTQQNGKHKVQHVYYSNTIVKKNIRKLAEEVDLQEANHREFASQGLMHPDMAKHMTVGKETDYYEPKTGDKVSGKVMHKSDTEVHMKQTADSYDDKKIGSVHKFKVSSKMNEAKKEDPPFDGPYTKSPGNVKDKSGAVHTPMSRARDLARQAMKKQMKEEQGVDLTDEQADELMIEALVGGQVKLDKNKNGKIDSGDLKMVRGEECPECGKAPCECGDHMKEDTYAGLEAMKKMGLPTAARSSHPRGVNIDTVEGWDHPHDAVKKKEVKEDYEVETRTLSFSDFMSQLNEYTPGPGGVTRVQGRSYGAQYRDPEGEDDADDKKKQVAKSEPAVKRGRGRPAGSKSGANQKVTTGKKGSGVDYTGYKLHLPNSNR